MKPVLPSAARTGSRVARLRRATSLIETLEPRQHLSAATLDTTFATTGKKVTDFAGAVDEAFRVKLINGKYLAVGQSGTDWALARYTSTGALDTTFSGDGKLTLNFSPAGSTNVDSARAIAVTPTGKVLVAGAGNGDFAVAKFNTDGSLDTTFGGGDGITTVDFFGQAGDVANDLYIRGDGKIVVGGTADDGAGGDIGLARLNADGSLDTTFGPGGVEGSGKVTYDFDGYGDGAFAIARGAYGRILVAGTVTWAGQTDPNVAGDTDMALLRFGENGTLDTTFAKGGTDEDGIITTDFTVNPATGFTNDYGSALAVDCTGSIYIGGTAEGSVASGKKYDFAVARFKGDGSRDTSFSTTGKRTVDFNAGNDLLYSLVQTPDQKVVLGGAAQVGTSYDFGVARLNTDGSLDANFNTTSGKVTTDIGGATDVGNSLYVGLDGKITLAGRSGNDFAVVRYTGFGAFDDGGKCAATPVGPGSPISDSVSSPTDVDLYQMDVNPGQVLTFDIDRPAGGTFDSHLRIFDGNGNPVASNDNGNAPGETGAVPGESYLSYTFPKGGSYYVGVSGKGNTLYNPAAGTGLTNATSTGPYTLVIGDATPASPTDADDQIAEAVATTPGTTKTGSISDGKDVDLYKVVVSAGQTLAFDVDPNTTGGVDSYLRLFNGAGDELATNDNAAAPGETLGTGSYLSYTFASAGTYYVGVSGAGNNAYDSVTGKWDYSGKSGGYSLVVSNVTSTSTDTNDQIVEATSVTTGTSISSSIVTGTDVNLYKIVVSAGQKIGFDVDLSGDSRLDSYLRIFNSGGTQIASNHHGVATGESASSTSYLSYTFTSAGTYYIGVSGYGNISYSATGGTGDVAGSTGAYTLVITDQSATFVDNNDQTTEATTISAGSTISGSIVNGKDVNVYKVTILANHTYTFDIDATNFDSYLRIFDINGVQVLFNNDAAAPGEGAGTQSFISHTFTNGGTYYVGVSGNPNTSYNVVDGTGDVTGATGNYTININDNTVVTDPDDQISEANYIGLNQAASGAIENGTDVDMFVVNLTGAGLVRFDVDQPTGSALNSYLRLFKADGTLLASNDNGTGPGETLGISAYIEYTFPAAGSYYIAISGAPNTAYSATAGTGDVAGSTGAYLFSVDYPNPGDPDDQVQEARAITINGAAAVDSIDNNIDVDMYRFTVVAGQTIAFDVDSTAGATLDSYLRIFDHNGTYYTTNDNGAAPDELYGKDSYVEVTFTIGGVYFVGISDAANYFYNALSGTDDTFGKTGGYTLTLKDQRIQDDDDQVDEAHTIAVGQTVAYSISTKPDVDLFKFTVTAGRTIAFDVDGSGGTFDPYLRIFDSNGSYYTTSDNGAAPDEVYAKDPYTEVTFTIGGTYYVGISGADNYYYDVKTGGSDRDATTGTYTLSLADVGAQDSNDQITEAGTIAVGSTITGTIATPTDVNLYRFTVSAGQKIAFDVDPSGGGISDAYLRIFDSNGSYYTTNDNGAGPGEVYNNYPYTEVTFTTGGTYYVGISSSQNYYYDVKTGGSDRNGVTGSYALSLTVI